MIIIIDSLPKGMQLPLLVAGEDGLSSSVNIQPAARPSSRPVDARSHPTPVEGPVVGEKLKTDSGDNLDNLRKLVEEAKNEIQMVRRDLSLSFDDETGRLIIKVIDRDSEEVVRQIPPEEILAFIRQLSKAMDSRDGGLIQEKV